MDLDAVLPRTKANENEIRQVILNLATTPPTACPKAAICTFHQCIAKIPIESALTCMTLAAASRNPTETASSSLFFTTKEVEGERARASICYKIVENHLGSIEFEYGDG